MRKKLSVRKFLIISFVVLVCLVLPLIFRSSVRKADTVQSVPYTQSEFIGDIAPDIQTVAAAYQLRASVIIAKAILDSDDGRTLLAEKYHNLFKVEAQSGESFISLKDSSGQVKKYKIYKTWKDSIYDYFSQIKSGRVGGEGFYVSLLSQKGYKKAAELFQTSAGDGTDTYAQDLITIIEQKQLMNYDE